jgi:Domain of unknown function (DUF5668)/N-terminal domain of toast_rack, DUF2154
MKKQSNGLVWGSLLLGFGLLILAKTLGWYHIDWGQVLRFWPVLIILAGVSLLVGRGQTWAGPVTAILLAIALPSAMVNKAQRHFGNNNFNWNGDNFNFNDNDDDNDDSDNDDEDSDSGSKTATNGNFSEALPPTITTAELNFEAGAGDFKIDGSTDQLFEAKTESEFGDYSLLTKRNDATKNTVVNFKMDGNKNDSLNINLNKDDWDDVKNKVKMQLSDKLIWDMKLSVGAGKGDFDLSNFKIQKLELNAGVSKIDLKLGDKNPLTEVEINTGVASLEVDIPESVGCEFTSKDALTNKDLDEFTEVSSGLYRTENYDKATKKIKISYKGGISSIKINRY